METRPLPPPLTPLPRGYEANARCDFYAGSSGNTTEKCLALKFKVQVLLDRKVIFVVVENTNMKNNPMPRNDGLTINAIKKSEDNVLIQREDQVKTLCLEYVKY